MTRRGHQVVVGDRPADRVGIGVLAGVFTLELVDRVVDEVEVREQRKWVLPARGVYHLVVSGAVDAGDGARVRRRSPTCVGGWHVMARLMEQVPGPLAGQSRSFDPTRISFTHARDAVRDRISDPDCFSPSRP